ncbi:hypothetical protein CMO83_00010 [Candidatus Woesearchaeota archaeon]|nr:hypothetical protein [Candidatus Woesearchaeota archaeon]|tara:strand:+ start:1667 stop:1867 length:201 start_codon:yes stop_codon:yes gene_type:complete
MGCYGGCGGSYGPINSYQTAGYSGQPRIHNPDIAGEILRAQSEQIQKKNYLSRTYNSLESMVSSYK